MSKAKGRPAQGQQYTPCLHAFPQNEIMGTLIDHENGGSAKGVCFTRHTGAYLLISSPLLVAF